MSPEDYQRAVDLFHEVFELDPDERVRALRERAPSPEILAEVEFMLGAAADDGFEERDLGAANQALLAATDEALEEIGPYRVVGKIGEGGMGVVYRAEQQNPRRHVAIKVLRGSAFGLADIRRFAREAALLGRLQHPGIAQIYESARLSPEQGGGTYIAMEFVDGTTITDYARRENLDLLARVRLLVELIRAVHHAHLRGVLHRDLKPSNVLVDTDGQIKIIDFGVARPLDAGNDFTQATMTGQVIGTLSYMSPEQARGDVGSVDARTDVYSLGVMAYELLGGRLPHALQGLSITEVARVINDVEPDRLGAVEPECRGDLELIVAKAMAKEPERRYQSAAALADDFERHTKYQPIEARPTSVVYQMRRFARRHRALVGGALTALIAIVVGAGIAVHYGMENAELAEKEKKARKDADDRAIEVTRRADPGRLILARQAAEKLWPALPSTVPAIDKWLRIYAEPLSANLPLHEEHLAELRKLALPYGETERERDRLTHPAQAELESARESYERSQSALAGTAQATPKLSGEEADIARSAGEALQRKIARLEKQVEERHTWEFADPEIEEQHEYMARLVADLKEFLDPDTGLRASVMKRRERAVTIAEKTVTGPEAAAAWKAAIADIRSLPVYRGLELKPQLGLLPLHRDPRSGLWEFWHVASGDRPEPNPDPDAVDSWLHEPRTGLVFVLLPGGKTYVGAQGDDPGKPNYRANANPGEGPVRELDMPSFFISKYEMTQSQWMWATNEQPSAYGTRFRFFGRPPQPEPITANTWWNPVESVSCDRAEAVLAQLDLMLPPVDAWEYAARGGTDTVWWPGDNVASLQGSCNLADGAVQKLGGPLEWKYEPELADSWVAHAPVGTFAANPFGLHDTIGNVWEWCRDEPQDGMAIAVGGSYENPAAFAAVTIRNFQKRDTGSQSIGLRPARARER